MVGGEILGTGVQVNAVESESLSAVGTTIASIINILRQLADYAYRVAVWLVQQLHEKPFESIAGAMSICILIA